MVSTRVVIAASTFLLFLAFGSGWLAFESDNAQFGYTTFEIAGTLGSTYGPCSCPLSNSLIDGWFWHLVAPILVEPGVLLLAMIAFPIGFVLSAVSLFKWKLMLVAGALSLLSGILWIVGLNFVQSQVVQGLNSWHGYLGRSVSSAVWAQAGPYIAIVGGVILLAGYALSRIEMLEMPID